ncbi:DUF2931 family protein [Flavobacterium gelidilacus]|uniref:DUF2931 family protein n=1 Tax=Flavobacterium gelidilacus TaxID=206041 RepID=UPI000407A63E|nr:DUF2931 family protein [Flavobacterium gelidilacus]
MKQEIPEFRTEISHPDKIYRITPIFDYIKTLEGNPAGLPYGSSSGSWGSSGKMWTAQKGMPIGFEITYYSLYENKYYEINEDFDVTNIKEMTNRCYPSNDEFSEEPVKEFITKDEFNKHYEPLRYYYEPFSDLIFGFAPQGMVVVWLGYGASRIELGRFQAKEITDKERVKECEEKYLSTYRIHPDTHKELIEIMHLDNPSPEKWDNYRLRYNWDYKISSENKGFKLFQIANEYFNGERENILRPMLLNSVMKEKAIPEMTTLFWETSAKERYQAKLFFDWDKTNEFLKTQGGDTTFNITINEDNTKLEIKVNGEPFPVKSIRIYPNSVMRYRESYKDF